MAWTVPNEVQDIPAEGLGDKIVAVRQGFVAPLADWKLIVRNLDGSHPCILSQSDVNSYSRDMLQRGFPGLAPRPSLDGRNLVWAERFVDEQGQKAKRVQAYDLSTGQLRTLAETTDVAHADLWAPTVSGDTAGWLEQQASGEVRQVLVSLSGGPFRALTLPEVPRSSAVLDDGRFLALSLESQTVVIELASSEATRVTDFGAWMYSNGHAISWAPISGHVGFYDAAARTIHLIDTRGAETVDA